MSIIILLEDSKLTVIVLKNHKIKGGSSVCGGEQKELKGCSLVFKWIGTYIIRMDPCRVVNPSQEIEVRR